MKYKLIAVMGKSGSGKDTFVRTAAERNQNLNKLISNTTRPIRENETQGIDYNFVKDDDFWNYKYLESSHFNNWNYGTPFSALSINKINIGIFNPEGIRSLLKFKEEIDLTVIYLTATDKNRMLRQLQREENPNVAEIIRRYNTDEKDFENIDFDCIQLTNNSILDLAVNLMFLAQKIH